MSAAQVVTQTVAGTIETTDIFINTIGIKPVSVVGGSTVAATVATAVAAGWNASVYPEFEEVTAAATSGGNLTLTADTAGVPFTTTPTTTETGGGAADDQTFTQATTTANSGPNDISVALNWSLGALPVNSDSVYLGDHTSDLLYGLDALAAVTGTTWYMPDVFEGVIGLPKDNAGGYVEYRPDYLQVSGGTFYIGGGLGNGSGRIKLNTGTGLTTLNVNTVGRGSDTNLEAIRWKGTHASNVVNISQGELGVAVENGEIATVLTLKGEGANTKARLGVGVTLGTVVWSGGSLEINSAVGTSLTVSGNGQVTINGTGAVAALIIRDNGRVNYNTSGALGGVPLVSGNGVLDFSGDPRTAKSVGVIDVYDAAQVLDPLKVVTSLAVQQHEGWVGVIVWGPNSKLTRTAVA